MMKWYLGDSKTPIASDAIGYAGDRHAYAIYNLRLVKAPALTAERSM